MNHFLTASELADAYRLPKLHNQLLAEGVPVEKYDQGEQRAKNVKKG